MGLLSLSCQISSAISRSMPALLPVSINSSKVGVWKTIWFPFGSHIGEEEEEEDVLREGGVGEGAADFGLPPFRPISQSRMICA